jgi:hypothetical protein
MKRSLSWVFLDWGKQEKSIQKDKKDKKKIRIRF